MPDYAKMYRRLFNAQTDAVRILQQAQTETEEMFVSAPAPDVRLLDGGKQDEGGDSE
jgi:hypothetical protein